jgi:ABC-type uncharacterized transport system auxiliary subunit
MIDRRAILTGSLTILCLLSTACIGGRPVRYYTVNHPAPGGASAKADGLVLLVGRISTPEGLEDSRIRYRAGANEVGAYEYHRWTERPALMVRDLLVQTLRASGKYRQVQETSSTVTGDYLIRGKLYEFAEVDKPEIQSRVSLQLEAVDRRTGMVVWNRRYDRDEPVSGKTMPDVVSSLEHNLQQVVTDAASNIESSLAGPR